MKKLIVGEIIVTLFLIIGVDYLPWAICWLPFLIYNCLYVNKIVEHIRWK